VPADTHAADYTIWVVAFGLYAVDAARLLSSRQLLLVEAGARGLAVAFSAHPFTLAGRVLELGPLLQPHRGVFVASWGGAWADTARLRAAIGSLEGLRGTLRPARLLAVWAFVVLFLMGPTLTLLFGPSLAIVYTAALLYPSVLFAIVSLWWQRRRYALGGTRLAWLGAELLVCPALLPNLVRKITALHAIDVDGAQILAATGAAGIKEEFLGRLESRAAEFVDGADVNPHEEKQLRSYVAAVKSACSP
jgi:hypothetical protein